MLIYFLQQIAYIDIRIRLGMDTFAIRNIIFAWGMHIIHQMVHWLLLGNGLSLKFLSFLVKIKNKSYHGGVCN